MTSFSRRYNFKTILNCINKICTSTFVVIIFQMRALTFEKTVSTCLNMIFITISCWIMLYFIIFNI